MTDASAVVRDVILRDGSTLRLRRPAVTDRDALVDFFARLSDLSLYYRFHGLPVVKPALVAPFIEPDGVEREALLGTLAGAGDEEGEEVVALASWARLRDPTCAEVAFAVEDELQGRGVGTRLLEQLAESARRSGVESFVADVLPENSAMLQVFEDAGFEVARAVEKGTIEVRFPIASTEAFRARVDLRDHTAVRASLLPFFVPRSVVVVGASARTGAIGGTIFCNIVAGGFPGGAYPVNRSGDSVAGVGSARSVGELPEAPELAVVCVPAEHVLGAVEELLVAGTRAVCVVSAGFAETGREGVERQERLLGLVRRYGARLLGPNCLGLAVSGSRLNATFARETFPPGPIGFVSQSGALGIALLEAADARGLGFSSFVSVGNKADVSTNDLLEYWEDEPGTALVILYVESFGNPRKFARIARRVARRKPVLAMKSGVSPAGARAALSHTAALAGSDAAVDALFHQAGVTRAATLEELLDVASLYTGGAAPRGRRVGILTNAGGLGILCADACAAAGLEVAELAHETTASLAAALPREASVVNPVDMLGSATGESYEAALPLLLADAGIDAVIVLFVPAAAVRADDVAGAIVRASRLDGSGKPVLAVVLSAEGIPAVLRHPGDRVTAYPYPESAARALGRAAERADWLRRPVGSVTAVRGVDASAARAVVEGALRGREEGWLDPAETERLLGAYRILTVEQRVVETAAAAAAAARELGFPAVVKTAEPGAHKTDIGGVALDVADEEAARSAAARIGLPVIVQPQIRPGPEVLAGLVQDPVFGPLVGFGLGGRLAELIGEAVFRIAPLTDVDAEELVLSGKAGRLVRGFRGAPPCDAAALLDLVHRLARLGQDLPEVAELDLNPVIGLDRGYVAVDSRVRVVRSRPVSGRKTW